MNLLLRMKRIKDLSPSERQVVNFILSDPESVSTMGIVELSQKTYTSTGTIVRLSKKLGLTSFRDFKRQIVVDLKEYVDTTILFKHQEPISVQDSLGEIVDKVTSSNARAVLVVRQLNTLETFEQVVEMMSAARQLDFYGSGVSNLICHDAMVKALRMGIPSTAFSFYSEMAMLARTCPRDHLAIVLSYTGQTADTLRVAEYLKQAQVPSVSITSNTDNALLGLCDVNLFVDSYESVYRIGGMSSRLSSQHLFDILFCAFMNKNYERVTKNLEVTFLNETYHQLTRDS